MPVNRFPVTILFFLLFNNLVVAQQKYPSTLLWKISGKNLTRSSYLYGTMHVQDRRLFYFGDSLYQALEKTEGFAMEINPDEMMDSLYKSLEKKDTSALLKKMLNESDYKRIAKKLEKKLKIPADKITAKTLADEKRRWNYAATKKDDMPTIMDLYLFSIARKQGKQVSGIEDLADQFSIVDELGNFKIDDFIKDDTAKRMNYLEEMKQTYLKRDLSTINDMVNGSLNNEFKDLFLIKRNIKMASRMDSISGLRSSFFAIGAAHLPGEEGVINLLRAKGYTVEPVFSSAFIAPEAYKYTAKEIIWQQVEDENKMCTVQMPGQPTSMTVKETLPMKMYMDLADLSVYGIAVTPLADEEAKSDSLFLHMEDNYKKMGFDIKSVKNIVYKNNRGVEMYGIEKSGGHFRNRFIINQNKLFIIIYGGKSKEQLYEANGERYLTSLSFNEQNIEGKNQWQVFTSEKNAFTMSVPGKTIEGIEKDEEGTAYDKYTAIDYRDGSYYLVIIRDTKPGFFMQNDSLYFEEYKNNLNRLTENKVKEFTITTFKGYNSARFSAVQTAENAEFILQGSLIRRGNRTYIPMVVSTREKADYPEITNFFRSFTLLPFKKANWKMQTVGNTNFSTMAPAVFEKVLADSTDYAYNARMQKYNVQDIYSASGYSVEVESLSPYYWSNSDSAFFKERSSSFKQYNDSVISYQFTDKPTRNAEVLIKLADGDIYKKLRFFLNGDTVYTVYTYQDEKALQQAEAKSFFGTAQFAAQYPVSIFNNKAAKLLQALGSSDSAIVAEARDLLYQVDFTKNDLPLLYEALIKKYNAFENDSRSINEMLADKIATINDSSVIAFARDYFKEHKDSAATTNMLLLQLLSKHKSSGSYALLKQLLLKKMPVEGSIYSLTYSMSDTLSLVKDFFPAVTALYADTVVGAAIAKIANQLLDSSLVLPAEVLQNETGLMALAKNHYSNLKADNESYPPYNTELIALLGKFNSATGNAMLNKFLALPVLWVKSNAIIALLKNNQPVAAAEIRKFAADKNWRTNFYSSLKEIKKTALFPKEFYTQQKFSESYLYNYLEEDYEMEVSSAQFVKEKMAMVNGIQQRFFLYKVLPNEEEATAHLAICGPFSADKTKVGIEDADLEVFYNYDEAYDPLDVEKQFAHYISEKQKIVK
jgi:uncharacterized protein YbaP (TraB family)